MPGVTTAMRILAIDQAAAGVVVALRASYIDPILLKGSSTARWLYPAEMRTYSDIDLLIARRDWDTAVRALESLGFSPLNDVPPPGTWTLHASTWRRAGDAMVVDLHHTIDGFAEEVAAYELLLDHRERMLLAGVEVTTLDESARCLVVALHAAHHGPAHQRSREDLARALGRVPLKTWRSAAALAIQSGSAATFDAGLRLIDAGQVLARTLRLESTGDDRRARLLAGGASAAAKAIHQMSSRPGIVPKARFAFSELFPDRAWMKARYPDVPMLTAYRKRATEVLRALPGAISEWRRSR